MNIGASAAILLSTLSWALANPKVVFPRLVEERSLNGELLLHIKDGLTLKLRKSLVAAPELRVVSFNDGKEVTNTYNGNEIQETIYHDAEKLAAVSLVRSNGRVEVEGVVGPHHRIEPVESMERSQDGQMAHLLHKIEKADFFDDPSPPSRSVSATRRDVLGRKADTKRSKVPDSVLVEIFFVLDSYHHIKFKNESALLRYLCIMIATVNIRLEETRKPTVQLAITGMERSPIGREPYLAERGNQISSKSTLANLRNYAYYKKVTYRYPDLVFLLTGRDAYAIIDGKKNVGLAGQAYLCGICTTEFVGLVEDKPGSYSGIHTLAHELGHSKAGAWCWRASYWRLINATEEYPGMTMNITEYCKRLFPNERNVSAERDGLQLRKCKVRCQFTRYSYVYRYGHWTTSSETFKAVRDALEYTPCKNDTKKVCIQGKCVGRRALKRLASTKQGNNME
ncbi:venom metalloproteinase antarease TserMP_A-like isoform X2 [Haemaphysalis longicornis]